MNNKGKSKILLGFQKTTSFCRNRAKSKVVATLQTVKSNIAYLHKKGVVALLTHQKGEFQSILSCSTSESKIESLSGGT
jgi:hypothetical protein